MLPAEWRERGTRGWRSLGSLFLVSVSVGAAFTGGWFLPMQTQLLTCPPPAKYERMIMALDHRFKLPQALCSNTVTGSRGSYSKGKKKVVSLQYSSVGESGEPAIFLTGEFLASVLQTWLNVGRHQPHPLSVPVTMQGLCEPDALQTGPPGLHIYVSPI